MIRSIFLLCFMCFPMALQAKDFIHPGILVTSKQIEFVRAHIDESPWKEAFGKALESKYADLSYQAPSLGRG